MHCEDREDVHCADKEDVHCADREDVHCADSHTPTHEGIHTGGRAPKAPAPCVEAARSAASFMDGCVAVAVAVAVAEAVAVAVAVAMAVAVGCGSGCFGSLAYSMRRPVACALGI